MCLIAYVPAGTAVPREVFDYSGAANPDGFGVMSAEEGAKRFFGRKALKRARRYSRLLSARNVAHAVHWRWATHGTLSVENCHPFATPNGHALIMHNGILSETARDATAEASDTALFVAKLTDAPLTVSADTPSEYWGAIEARIGFSNKFVVLSGSTFYLLNEDAGIWLDGVWYSNTYSLPASHGGDADTSDEDAEDDKWIADYRQLSGRDALDAEDARTSPLTTPGQDYSGYGAWAPGKRFNIASMKWEWPPYRRDERPALPSGPTLDAETVAHPYADRWQDWITREADRAADAELCLPNPNGYRDDN